MKKLSLISLHLQQFKGQTFDLVINGKNANVYGDNGTGKTSLYDALCWLLFDKDSSFKSQFEIKNLAEDGSPVHNLSHEVKGLFKWDGKVIELRKVFTEKWTKKRGQAKAEFTGHETQHHIDGVPVNQSEYRRMVAEIASEDHFKLLTNPFYFPQVMKWQDRRAMLMELCGDIDVRSIAADPRYAPLVEVLRQGRSIEDHRKVVMARRKEVNEQLQLVPARIDEVIRSLGDVTGINHLHDIERISSLTADLEKLESKIAGLKNGGAAAELKRQLAEAQHELIGAELAVSAERQHINGLKMANASVLQRCVTEKQASIESMENSLRINTEAAESIRGKLAVLVEEWQSLDAGKVVDTSCPTCGQEMPEEKIEEIVATNNERISSRKSQIDRQGRALKEQLDSTVVKMAKITESIKQAMEKLEEAKNTLSSQTEAQPDVSLDESPELIAAREKVAHLQERLAGEDESDVQQEIAEAEASAMSCRQSIEASQKRIAAVEASQKAQDRKTELEKEEKALAAEFERLEGELYMIDNFTREKVELLEGQVNGAFRLARFKLFSEQVNGGLNECCSVTYNGIPFETSLNNGARINVGLDIIDIISGKLGKSLPVFIDNAESVTALHPMESQVIRLVVSDHDNQLRVEVSA